jgi:hypothetical protein
MKKFLPVVLLPILVVLGSCTTTKKLASVDSVGDSAAADTTVSASTNALETTAASDSSAEAVPTVVADTAAEPAGTETTLSSVDSAPASAPTDSQVASDSQPSDTTPKQAVSSVSIQPGQSTDKFVGAASDVTTEVCKSDGTDWVVSGKVKNSSGAAANYRIYVALNRKGSTDTRALVQVDKSVADGKTEPWDIKAAVSDSDLVCILRVERTAA